MHAENGRISFINLIVQMVCVNSGWISKGEMAVAFHIELSSKLKVWIVK